MRLRLQSVCFASLIGMLLVGAGCTGSGTGVTGDGDGDGDGDIGIPIFNFDGGDGDNTGGDGDGDGDSGDGDGDGDLDGGTIDGGGPPVNGPVQVHSVTPPTGELNPAPPGLRVRIDGLGFSPESRVFFGENEATQVIYVSVRVLTCYVPPGDEAGPITVRVVDPLGEGELEGAFTYFSPVTILSLTPSSGSTEGGTLIEATGAGFHDEMLILFDDRQVIDLAVNEDGTVATFVAPAGDSPGRVNVEAIDTFGRSVLELGYRYIDDLALESVAPNVVAFGESPILDVRGAGFTETTSFTLGGQATAVDNLVAGDRVRLFLPAGLTGLQDLVAVDGASTATLPAAVYVFGAPSGSLQLDAALPPSGDVLGGTTVELFGEGLSSTTSVTVGGVPVASITVVGDGQLTIVTPAGAEGAATIEVTTSSGTATLPFTYLVPLRISDVFPPAGPIEGGTPVTLTGRRFSPGTTVTVGGVAMPVTFVSDTSLTGVTPPGSSGPADVVVHDAGDSARLDEGFIYETGLKVLGVMPPRGGISGGTYVRIAGAGFSRGVTGVSFGLGLPLATWEVISDNQLAVYTPPNPADVVDVTVTVTGGAAATAEGAFTYFDPSFLVGGTRGGPIDGAIYLTALDAFTGLPIPDLVVFTGTLGSDEHMTMTNIIGQATISGPDVYGPHTVSVVGDGYEYASFVDIDAAEITVFLQPLNLVPPQDGELPPPPPPATLRGKVFGFAKEFFDPAALGPDEVALALITTTARDEFSRIPNPGADNVVFTEGGEYFIANARPGRLAVVALAGIFNLTTSEFRMRQMGVRRNVYPQLGVNLEDQDIELTIPLDEDIDLSLPDAPLGLDDGPNITRVVPFLQFGGEGSLAYTTAVQASRNHPLAAMPDVPGEMLTFIAGAYRTDGTGLVTQQGTATLIQGSKTVLGTATNWGDAAPNMPPAVNGAILVVDRPDGGQWAVEVLQAVSASEILIAEAAPFSGGDVTYHIGNPGYPSSEVVQDGAGSLVGGVTIQPVLGLPEPIEPLENGVLGPERNLRWKPAAGQQPSLHQMYVYDPIAFSVLWTFYIDGSRSKVPIPRIPEVVGDLPLETVPLDLFAGGFAWQHTTMYIPEPGFAYTNWSYLDIGRRARRSWTTDVHLFVYGGE